MKFTKKLFVLLSIVLAIGMLISLFLVYEHFSPSASKYCTFGENLDCGIVNKSPYANLDGIFYLLVIDFGMNLPIVDFSGINWVLDLANSNAFMGFLTLVLLFFLLKAKYKNTDFLFIDKNSVGNWLRGITLFGVFYGAYLLLIQHYILKTYCIFCLVLDFVLAIIMILVWRIK